MSARREHQARLLRRATAASVATAVVLVLVKGAGWAATGAVSILASLIDSLMDAGASLVNLVAVRYALQPADADHRFGHGKSEALAGLGQAAFIGGSSLFLVLHAVDRLLHPVPLQAVGTGIAVMGFALAATVALVLYQRHVVRATGSTAVRADALHYLSDILANGAVLAALPLAAWGWPGLDPVFAIAVALYVAWSAGRIGRDAVHILMDRELPAAVQNRIRTLARAEPEVAGVHDLRTRRSGLTMVVQLHLELDPQMTLEAAHAVAKRVERAIRDEFPGSDITIHQDPEG